MTTTATPAAGEAVPEAKLPDSVAIVDALDKVIHLLIALDRAIGGIDDFCISSDRDALRELANTCEDNLRGVYRDVAALFRIRGRDL